jgi:hypothetical protein
MTPSTLIQVRTVDVLLEDENLMKPNNANNPCITLINLI